MSNITLADAVELHQAKAEWMFAAAVFIDPEYGRESCGWLDPSMLNNASISRYWRVVKDGGDPAQASIDAQIYFDVVRYVPQVDSSFHAPAFAHAIAEDAYFRNTAGGLSEMAKAITDRDSAKLRALAEGIMQNSPTLGAVLPNAVDIGQRFQVALDNIENVVLPTGIEPLDNNMGGVERSTLVVIGGRPGMGKTTAGLQIAVHNSKEGRRVIYFSAEMSANDLWARLACGRAGVDWRMILSQKATPEQVELVRAATVDLMDELEDRLLIDDNPLLTNEDIFRQVGRYKPDLIVVDHLDLVDRQQRGKLNEVIRVGNNSRMGKIIAKQFNIPAVYLMQLNRQLENRENKRPQLSDIRASGEVEQDADIVIFIHRPDYFAEEESKAEIVDAELWLEKVRNGAAHVKAMTKLNLKKQWFYAIEKRRQP